MNKKTSENKSIMLFSIKNKMITAFALFALTIIRFHSRTNPAGKAKSIYATPNYKKTGNAGK